jgi:ATP-dependent DNA helicase PIF1
MKIKASNMGGLMDAADMVAEMDPLVGHLSEEQLSGISLIESGRNVFLTGQAGTGKSTLTAALVARHAKTKGLYVCGSTGIAAFNLADRLARDLPGSVEPPKVTTLHRWSGVGLGPDKDMPNDVFFREWFENRMTRSKMGAMQRARSARCLVLDEVSMIPGRLLDYLDWHLRHVRGVPDAPFGGVQIVAVGDFLQLPPVAKDGNYDWAFASASWEAADMTALVLREIHRQAAGPFTRLLNACRVGQIDGEASEILAGRVARFPSSDLVRMMTHNVQVGKWNDFQLSRIDAEEKVYWMGFNEHTAEWDQKTLCNNILAPKRLALKVGAKVMVVANLNGADGEMLACNGTLGRVLDMEESRVWIRTDDGKEIGVPKQLWTLNPLEDESPGAFQIPLRPAYAMTIHKSQGLSLDAAVIDARAAREPGQTYVALSRLRSLEGLHLKEPIRGVVTSNRALAYMREVES